MNYDVLVDNLRGNICKEDFAYNLSIIYAHIYIYDIWAYILYISVCTPASDEQVLFTYRI